MRKLKEDEYNFIKFLLENKNLDYLVDKLNDYYVEEMDDGGMGSLKFFNSNGNSSFGKEIFEASILDNDGVPVSFAINLDQKGEIYELDAFKADFSALIRFPPPPYKWLNK